MKGSDRVFLKEEDKLIRTLAERIGQTIEYKQFREDSREKGKRETVSEGTGGEWRAIVEMLRKTDRKLYIYIAQKMLYFLCWSGIEEANRLLERFGADSTKAGTDENQPLDKGSIDLLLELSSEVFRIGSEQFSNEQITAYIHQWIQEDKSRFLVRAMDNPSSTNAEIIDALTKYRHNIAEGYVVSDTIKKGIRVSLVRRFLSDQLEFIEIAKNVLDVEDYFDIVKHVVLPVDSHGKLGGKSAGLFLASNILRKADPALYSTVRTPKTWYITSDGHTHFLYYNNMEEFTEQKYKDISEVTIEYRNVVRMFKIAHFPPEIIKGLSAALDDIGEVPIIVRSSSLLEDRLGASFSGKYKSLFLANAGPRQERLEALLDAIAEIYASIFAPDPIEYRRERGLLDFFEEMGIMIQEVVGNRVGDYFFPAFAGVAFSSNEFRWSPKIRRQDGLVRMVPGLGTRAVDRVGDDYPILISPGRPELRVNVTPDEVYRYSPRYMDVINMKEKRFETVAIRDLLKVCGHEISGIQNMISIYRDNFIHRPTSSLSVDFEKDDIIMNFEGLLAKTPFLKEMKQILTILQEKIGSPVDVEFAHDGNHLYLLQCRAQGYSRDDLASPIPRNIPEDSKVFSAKRYVSNGHVPDIKYIVYVVPEAYEQLSDLNQLKQVGRSVGKLNKMLPKRRYILMGPGRWGSRGDIKLGVSVTYSDINNTAVLIEIAKRKGHGVPDLSFGTHFFQDLVESSIRYLPLYPDDEGVVFNEHFLLYSKNLLTSMIPEASSLSHVIRVINIPESTKGMSLRILMNADLDEAVAYLIRPATDQMPTPYQWVECPSQPEDFWKWRYHMAEHIASKMDPKRFGVAGFYLFGSVKRATAGPASDINILIHFRGTARQKKDLLTWLEGWSMSLSETNFLRTGYRKKGLLDVRLITDEDIENKTDDATKISTITDPAIPLPVGTALD